MELAFDSKSLRTICENEDYAKQELGPAIAAVLRHRLADLRVGTSIKDIIVGRIHLSGDKNQNVTVELCDGYQLLFCTNHPKNPMDEFDKIDWSRVNRIKILIIGRAYD